MDEAVRLAVDGGKVIEDSQEFAAANGFAHAELVGLCKSLATGGFITTEATSRQSLQLTKEGELVVTSGSPEAVVFGCVPAEGGIASEELDQRAGAAAKVGLSKAIQNKWLQVVKQPLSADELAAAEAAAAAAGKKKAATDRKLVQRLVGSVEDAVQAQLRAAKGGSPPPDAELAVLKKRGLLAVATVKALRVAAGPQHGNWGRKPASDLTHEMVLRGTWRDALFKPVNVDAAGVAPAGGALHPLLKVRSMFREIFLEMGFAEMPTQQYVESSFWNFDALYQPQQHPARDAHDTFFIKTPAQTRELPADYMERVRATHEVGGEGLSDEFNSRSTGWRYDWSEDEARKNLLRTHTTAASSRTLYQIAQLAKANGGAFQPQKYFSIDRVFRNEALDATHLAEFHQVEGFVIDRNLSLGNLMGTIADFYRRLGPEFKHMKFKPTYNPYTEPSMEFHCYHEGLGKWVEVGDSRSSGPPLGPSTSTSIARAPAVRSATVASSGQRCCARWASTRTCR